jgi:two-component system, sensor histidine kinase
MFAAARLPVPLLARVRADQVATQYARCHLTSVSMAFGALLLCAVMWSETSIGFMVVWLAVIAVNQTWRAMLARAFQRARPGIAAAPRWGRYWAFGTALSGALWGVAGFVMFPTSPAHQALLIVCLFGVVMGGLNLTAMYKPSFYGFVLPALLPLIARVAMTGDSVHLYIAIVMTVVLAFLLGFGHRLNDALTNSLAIRYQNLDLIGELRERTRAALEARQAAETANRAKSQLLVAASHDLRQPLHALGLYVAALAAQVRGTASRLLVSNVQGAVCALETHVDQLIDLSRLETGALVPERGLVPLAPLFTRLAAEFAPQARARGLRFAAVNSRLAVDSDAALLERILRNLLANAVSYTMNGGIVMGARRRGDQIVIEVVDTGIGIAPTHRDRIFEEFYRVRDPERSDRSGKGLGLGLALVRRFADLLDHRITVTSRLGHGSRFAIALPRVACDARISSTRTASIRTAANTTRALPGSLVAIVDDDDGALDAMCTLFRTWGAQVVSGASMESLLVACAGCERSPDLIVADLRLDAHSSGIEAIARLRAACGVGVPGLIVSGDIRPDAERQARNAGLVFLAKPVDAGALQSAARTLLRAGTTLHA